MSRRNENYSTEAPPHGTTPHRALSQDATDALVAAEPGSVANAYNLAAATAGVESANAATQAANDSQTQQAWLWAGAAALAGLVLWWFFRKKKYEFQ